MSEEDTGTTEKPNETATAAAVAEVSETNAAEETTTDGIEVGTTATNAAADDGAAVAEASTVEGTAAGFYSEGNVAAADVVAAAGESEEATTPTTAPVVDPIIVEEGAIWEPAENDVLSGRGAHVNSWQGNKIFRALCFARKAQFEAGNHAAKRRIAVEIWTIMVKTHGSRFLKKRQNKGPWYEMTTNQAILKAQQVMRDYKRPDRIIQRELMAAAGRKRNRATATPMDNVVVPPPPTEPLLENPEGVTENDVLCGRGAFCNAHSGNQQLRKLATERKVQFDAGSYTEKRALATEIVEIIRNLEPAGRFLRKPKAKAADGYEEPAPAPENDEWEEVDQEKAIHKACQVMRDINRPDRRERDERRRQKKLRKEEADAKAEVTKIAAVAAAETNVVVGAENQHQAVQEAIASVEVANEKGETPTKTEGMTESV